MEKKTKTSIKRVKLYTGSMYAGKSNAVVEYIELCKKNKKKAICFKHTFDDDRYGKNKVLSRTGKETEAYSVKNYKDIEKIIKENKGIKAIAIDELQFFGINNKKEVEGFIKMIKVFSNQGIEIFLAGLDRDFKNEYFPITKKLIGDGLIKSKNITYLTAECSVEGCCEKGTCTGRIIKNKNLVVVGDGDKYKAVCEKHHDYCNEDIDYNKIKWKNFKKKKSKKKQLFSNYHDKKKIEDVLKEIKKNRRRSKTFAKEEIKKKSKKEKYNWFNEI